MPSYISSVDAKAIGDAIKSLSESDRHELIQKLNAAKLDDLKAAADTRRLAKISAALEDDKMRPVVLLAKGHLQRIGMTFAAASDVAALNKAMTEHKLDTARRIELKRLLATIGIID